MKSQPTCCWSGQSPNLPLLVGTESQPTVASRDRVPTYCCWSGQSPNLLLDWSGQSPNLPLLEDNVPRSIAVLDQQQDRVSVLVGRQCATEIIHVRHRLTIHFLD